MKPIGACKGHGARDERGASLIEVMVAMVMLTSALLGLAGAAGLAVRSTNQGRQDLQLWMAVQWAADSLYSVGAGGVVNGSDVVQGRSVSWTVSGANPVRIELLVGRLDSRHQTVQDTILLYLGS